MIFGPSSPATWLTLAVGSASTEFVVDEVSQKPAVRATISTLEEKNNSLHIPCCSHRNAWSEFPDAIAANAEN